MSRVARSAVRLGTRLWLLQFAALPAAAVEARGCEKQLDCGSCVAHGCTFCDSKDVRSCFEPGSASAHSGICRDAELGRTRGTRTTRLPDSDSLINIQVSYVLNGVVGT